MKGFFLLDSLQVVGQNVSDSGLQGAKGNRDNITFTAL